ncbi:MAG: hypothetical protein LBP92_04790 [Deltaproteobacteria bacterium]|nr:hypothetical protein [Deltaproteobacteria bacterium]
MACGRAWCVTVARGISLGWREGPCPSGLGRRACSRPADMLPGPGDDPAGPGRDGPASRGPAIRRSPGQPRPADMSAVGQAARPQALGGHIIITLKR